MASKPTSSHLNNSRHLPENQPTWDGEKSRNHTQSVGIKQKQSKDSPTRKRKRSSNTSNAMTSDQSSSTQGNAPMPVMNPQEANPDPDKSKTGLACHYYKMNPKQHSSCRAKTFQSISSLGQHIRLAHGRKGRHSCNGCFQSFLSEPALHAHDNSGICRPTGGIPADELPTVTHKHGTPASKWSMIWDQLFPNFEQPRSAYCDESHEIDQFVQFFLRTLQASMPGLLQQDQQNIAVRLKREASRWRSEPGEPLDHALIPAGPPAT
ncbi:hypothetical protein PG984_013672 [Apiospora sp. TS-2023a]